MNFPNTEVIRASFALRDATGNVWTPQGMVDPRVNQNYLFSLFSDGNKAQQLNTALSLGLKVVPAFELLGLSAAAVQPKHALQPGERRVCWSLPQRGKAFRAIQQIVSSLAAGHHVLSTVQYLKDLGMHLNDIRAYNQKYNATLSPIWVTKTSIADLVLHLQSNEPRFFIGLSGAHNWKKFHTAIVKSGIPKNMVDLVDDEGDKYPLGLLILDPDRRSKGELGLEALMKQCYAMMKLTATPGPLFLSLETTVAEEVQAQKIPGFEMRDFFTNAWVDIDVRHGAPDMSHPDFKLFWVNELTKGQEYASLLINADHTCDGHMAELSEISRHWRRLPEKTALITMNGQAVVVYDKRLAKVLGRFSSRPKDALGNEFGTPYADIQAAYDFCQANGYNHRVVVGKTLVMRAGRFNTSDYTQPLTAVLLWDTDRTHLEMSIQSLGRTNGQVPIGTPAAKNYCSGVLRQDIHDWTKYDLPALAAAINQDVPLDEVQFVGEYARDISNPRIESLLKLQLRKLGKRRSNDYGEY